MKAPPKVDAMSWLWFPLLCASCFQYLEMGQLSSLQLCNRAERLPVSCWDWIDECFKPLAKLRSAQSCWGQSSLSGTEDWHHAWHPNTLPLSYTSSPPKSILSSYSVFTVGGEEKGVLDIITCRLFPYTSIYAICHWKVLAELRFNLRMFHTVCSVWSLPIN